MLGLHWHDVDLDQRVLTVTSYKGKTVQSRELYITSRMLIEFERLKLEKPVAAGRVLRKTGEKPAASLVFGITDNVQWAWESARSEAGLDGLRFHDLRHTAATRLASEMQVTEVGRVLGHSNPTTTYRYVNRTPEMVRRAGQVLEQFHADTANELDTVAEHIH